jgi:ubiquinone/menaquinone biosynthesis C-methylase UbiE
VDQAMKKFELSWEQAIELLRKDPAHQKLIYDSYLTSDLEDNCHRFYSSNEFAAILEMVEKLVPGARKILDLPAGNGIASYAFAKKGFDVTAVEPDPSATVGSAAIGYIKQQSGLTSIKTVGAFAEDLPFANEEFDLVYVRQGLHHAKDLRKMVSEAARVTKRGGVIIATREHVVDDYDEGLQSF